MLLGHFSGANLMKRITGLLVVTLLWLCAAAASAQPPAPKELDAKVVEAWRKAGAEVGWYWHDKEHYLQGRFSEVKPDGVVALPAFRFLFRKFDAGVIADLPDPSVPFALDIGGTLTGLTDAGLK